MTTVYGKALDWLKEASKFYSEAQTLKEELKQKKKYKFVCFGWRKKNG